MARKKKSLNQKADVIDMLSDVFSEIYRDLKKDVLSYIPRGKKLLEKHLRLASKKINGQKVSVIGPPGAGKTSLLKVLDNPEIERSELEKYNKTGAREIFKSFSVKWNVPIRDGVQVPFKFKVAAGIDNGGEDYIREGHWLEAIQNSAVIFYLFDIEKVNCESGYFQEANRIISDFDWIGAHVNSFSANFTLIPICNKVDTCCKSLKEFQSFKKQKMELLNGLFDEAIQSVPKGYQGNIKKPIMMSLYDRQIRNEQFSDLMLYVIGDDLMDLINESNDKNKGKAA